MKTNPELQAEELPKGKTPKELHAEMKKLERELRKLRRMIADADQPEMKIKYLEAAEQMWELRQQYMDSLEYNQGSQPLPSCGGIQPPFILTMDKEE